MAPPPFGSVIAGSEPELAPVLIPSRGDGAAEPSARGRDVPWGPDVAVPCGSGEFVGQVACVPKKVALTWPDSSYL